MWMYISCSYTVFQRPIKTNFLGQVHNVENTLQSVLLIFALWDSLTCSVRPFQYETQSRQEIPSSTVQRVHCCRVTESGTRSLWITQQEKNPPKWWAILSKQVIYIFSSNRFELFYNKLFFPLLSLSNRNRLWRLYPRFVIQVLIRWW